MLNYSLASSTTQVISQNVMQLFHSTRLANLTTLKVIFLFASVLYVDGIAMKIASAQELKPLSIADATQTRHFVDFSATEFSPDGKWLATVVRSDSDFHGTDILIISAETREEINLTNGRAENWAPQWSPDGRFLAFVSNRSEGRQAQVWIWNKTRNDLQKLSNASVVTPPDIRWTGDGRGILVTLLQGNPHSIRDPEASKLEPHNQNTSLQDAKGATVTLYQSSLAGTDKHAMSDPWNPYGAVSDLVRIDVPTGRLRVILHGQRILTYRPSPNGTLIAYTVAKGFERAGNGQTLFDLVTVSTASNRQYVVASGIRLNYDGAQFSWSPDGNRIAYMTSGFNRGQTADCYVVSAIGGDTQNITHFEPESEPDLGIPSIPVWDKEGNYLYFVKDGALWHASVHQQIASLIARIPNHTIRGTLIARSDNLLWTLAGRVATVVLAHDNLAKQDGFFEIGLNDGKVTTLLERGECYTCDIYGYGSNRVIVASNGENVAYLAEDAQHDSDLWVNVSSFKSPRRITRLNPQFDRYQFGAVRLVAWLSDDGEPLRGVLLLPSGYRKGKRYPLVVAVYGGGLQSNSFDHFGLVYLFPMNMQLLATRGYAVLLPDSPSHDGTAMSDLLKTVLPGVNKVIESGIADPERVGVVGHSNGGYSTLALIVQTNRFKVAAELDGWGDCVGEYGEMNKDGTAYGTTLLEHNQDVMGGTPWQFRERYLENSPFFYLDRVTTPLLIIHGTDDKAVAQFLGDQLYVALRRLGKEVTYAEYEGEGHVPTSWSYPNKVDAYGRILSWLDKYLLSSTPEGDPPTEAP